jgi:hypothetical protein
MRMHTVMGGAPHMSQHMRMRILMGDSPCMSQWFAMSTSNEFLIPVRASVWKCVQILIWAQFLTLGIRSTSLYEDERASV